MTTGTVLAVKPGSREFGYALFRDGVLVDQNVKSLRRSHPPQSRVEVLRRTLGDLLSDEQPYVLALEQSSSVDTDRYPVSAQVPDTAPLLWAAVSCVGRDQVRPPSVERAITMGSGENTAALPKMPLGLPMKSVQAIYTLPKKGLDGSASAQMDTLSLNSTGLSRLVAIWGELQFAPLSSEKDTATSSEDGLPEGGPARPAK